MNSIDEGGLNGINLEESNLCERQFSVLFSIDVTGFLDGCGYRGLLLCLERSGLRRGSASSELVWRGWMSFILLLANTP